jgi:hypothetical protein
VVPTRAPEPMQRGTRHDRRASCVARSARRIAEIKTKCRTRIAAKRTRLTVVLAICWQRWETASLRRAFPLVGVAGFEPATSAV